MVCAWPRIMSPRSAWFFSICCRSSGEASKTTPLPKIGVMKGYAAAWSSTSSGARKNASLASAPRDQHDVLVGQPEAADVTALLPYPGEQPIGSTRISGRWPVPRMISGTVGTLVVQDRRDLGDAGERMGRWRRSWLLLHGCFGIDVEQAEMDAARCARRSWRSRRRAPWP